MNRTLTALTFVAIIIAIVVGICGVGFVISTLLVVTP